MHWYNMIFVEKKGPDCLYQYPIIVKTTMNNIINIIHFSEKKIDRDLETEIILYCENNKVA